MLGKKTEQEILAALIQEGCDLPRLNVLMRLLRRAQPRDNMETVCGFRDGRQLASSIATVKQAAACIRRWTASIVGHVALGSDPHMRMLAEDRAPKLLEWFADRMEELSPAYTRRRRLTPNLSRAWLTNYVHERTKRWHDAEVSDLVSLALGGLISAADQKQWRADNCRLLDSERTRIMWAITPILSEQGKSST